MFRDNPTRFSTSIISSFELALATVQWVKKKLILVRRLIQVFFLRTPRGINYHSWESNFFLYHTTFFKYDKCSPLFCAKVLKNGCWIPRVLSDFLGSQTLGRLTRQGIIPPGEISPKKFYDRLAGYDARGDWHVRVSYPITHAWFRKIWIL